jgi:hypothetical protein
MTETVSFTDRDKSLEPSDIAVLEHVLGYKVEVPDSFFEAPEDERRFVDYLQEVLFDANKAVWLDWRWDARELFHQLATIFPSLEIKLINSAIDNADSAEETVVKVEYEIEGQAKAETIGWDSLNDWIGKLNELLVEKTEAQLVAYASGGDEYLWFVAPKDFSEEEFNKATTQNT